MKILIAAFALLCLGSIAQAQNNTCAQNCLQRDYNGKCLNAGPDYCGPDARCAKHCVARYFTGQCSTYAADFCGANASCVERCVSSYNGTCSQWGEDHCYTR